MSRRYDLAEGGGGAGGWPLGAGRPDDGDLGAAGLADAVAGVAGDRRPGGERATTGYPRRKAEVSYLGWACDVRGSGAAKPARNHRQLSRHAVGPEELTELSCVQLRVLDRREVSRSEERRVGKECRSR